MKFISTYALVAAVATTSVHAIGSLGFDIGTQRNSDAQCKTTADYNYEFSLIKSYADIVRVYAVSDCNTLQNLAPALVQSNFSAFLGVWPNDELHYSNEKSALAAYLPLLSVNNVLGITVGSEALYRKDLTPAQLAAKINDIKTYISLIKDRNGVSYSTVPVGTADSWNLIIEADNIPVIQASDIILANAFAYWQGVAQEQASSTFTDDIKQALRAVQAVKGTNDVKFWVGETGWPTAGGNYENSIPSVENALDFWQNGVCAIRAWGINTIVFEVFDESWKPDSIGRNGQSISGVEKHWGVLNADGHPKYDLTCKY